MKITTMDTLNIEKLYSVTNEKKFESILEEVRNNGFKNVPAIVVLETEECFYAITGSHRWEVAAELGLEIPVELFQMDEIETIRKRKDVDYEGLKVFDRLV